LQTTALVAGHSQFGFGQLNTNVPQHQIGKLRILAVTGPVRHKLIPDVPTFAELGYPDFNVSQWYGLLGPPRMAPELVSGIQAEVAKALKSADVRDRLETLGNEPVGTDPATFHKTLEAEVGRWRLVIKESGLDLR